MNQKSIVAILGVIIILIGVIVYFATTNNKESQPVAPAPVVQQPAQPVATQPAPTPTVPTLVTYTNVKWGFEVGYPTGYEVKTDVEKATELDLSIRKIGDKEEAKNNDGGCANCALWLQVIPKFIGGSEKGAFKTPEEWIKFQKSGGLIGSGGLNYLQTTLAGKIAYTINEQGTGRKTYLVFVADGVMYDRYDIGVKGNDSNADIILSTFKITK